MNKNKTSNIILTVLILFAVGFAYFTWRRYQWYNPPYSSEINTVLFMAGDNRKELEKVLKHYDKNPADSLKLRAAEFLIVNMPGKYSRGYEGAFENVVAAHLRWDKVPDKQSLMQTLQVGQEYIHEDIKYITGEYLINNIELSFKVWKEQPWGKHVPFDVFCEEILPYRVGVEPLENWREKALACFADLYNVFQRKPDITAVEACCMLNSQLPDISWSTFTIPSNYSMLMASRRGTCEEISNLTIFIMRALGIPVTYEYTIKWHNLNVGHSWNAVSDSSGRHISFAGREFNPGLQHSGRYSRKNKAYRKMFALQNQIKTEPENIPAELRNPFAKDVSKEYEEFTDIEIPVRFPHSSPSEYIYLMGMGAVNWNMIGWGETDNRTMRFSVSTRAVLYLPVYYENNTRIPANYPFMYDKDGEVQYFEPDTLHSRKVNISEISPASHVWFPKMQSGVFEGANRSDFSDAHELHTIQDVPGNHFNVVKINNPEKYRYLRYVSPSADGMEARCNVAEIQFFDSGGRHLSGTPVGTGAFYFNHTMTHDKAFDGDVITCYDGMNSKSWTGLDLGEARKISEIRYLPRDDSGSGIYEGHVYELLYWTGQQWLSLGQKKVALNELEYEVPSNALLYLRNVTTGKDAIKVFTEQDGEQKWN